MKLAMAREKNLSFYKKLNAIFTFYAKNVENIISSLKNEWWYGGNDSS